MDGDLAKVYPHSSLCCAGHPPVQGDGVDADQPLGPLRCQAVPGGPHTLHLRYQVQTSAISSQNLKAFSGVNQCLETRCLSIVANFFQMVHLQ